MAIDARCHQVDEQQNLIFHPFSILSPGADIMNPDKMIYPLIGYRLSAARKASVVKVGHCNKIFCRR
ncbi:hypothetical protein [Novosphingobium humi]|uniref:hypothetical protein n=1 Tax=Novosphingobium humi TaxID=2282397 RepID=UPI0025AEF1A4|nr:hypothetical protein [Novosphingobium humi]WJT00605.1 hypothetical protein NYQ05_20240 [Novosphingobium humi]